MSLSKISCAVTHDLHHYLKAEERADNRASGIACTADLMLDDRRDELAEGFTEALYGPGTPAEAVAEFHAFVGKEVLCGAFERDPAFCRRYPALAEFARQWIDTAAEAQMQKEAA
ncbi:hypothetical protein [Aquitalea aquatilis]|uniref:hypothetical protein n=1 Tax=Aquitalea aquatilis TaxID=1537400 RepID=UPI0010BD9485|nr:hypothetical protein [Aquitalea aquatilis]